MASYVLIAEGDLSICSLLETAITKLGLHARTMNAVAEALTAIESEEAAQRIALAIVDLHLPDGSGLEVVRKLREALIGPIIVLAPPEDASQAQDVFDAGAAEFIIKPLKPERIATAVKNVLKVRALEGEIARITRKVDGRRSFADIICTTPEMNRAVVLGRRAADLDLPVLIEGEVGAGKELFAKAIYGDSARVGKPFIMVHCADPASAADWSTRETFLEDSWSEAEGGVLYLDEISEMPLAMQETLSGFLGTGDPAKHDPNRRGNVRLICSTSQNLIERVKAGKFREDLYYRINVFPIWLPPLRDRVDDIEELVEHFLTLFTADEGKHVEGIDEEALTLLKAYSWPGNVRQLENIIYRAVALAESDRLTLNDFPQIAASMHAPVCPLQGAQVQPQAQPRPAYQGPAMIGAEWPVERAITVPGAVAPTLGIPALTQDGEIRTLTDIEADLIRLALGHYRGHITEVARRLGIGRSTLYRKMREFGLEARHN